MTPTGHKVRIGILGAAGSRMNFSHLRNLHANPRAQFRAFCDLDIRATERIIADHAYEVDYVTRDADRLMHDPDIDLLVAGLPHHVHKDMLLRAAKAGKDIFIEKPMVLGLEELDPVIDAVRTSGIRVMVGHNRRFAPNFVEAKRIYTSEMGGKPAILMYRVADPIPYKYDRPPEGGRIYDEMSHFFDLFAWFLEAEPVQVYTEGGWMDFVITIRFDDGSRGALVCSTQGGMGYPKELFECFCDFQTVALEGNVCLTHAGKDGKTFVRNYPLMLDPYPDMPADLHGYRLRMQAYAHDVHRGRFKTFSHPSGYKGHYEELDACLEAVLNRRPFPSNEVDGARTIVCCDAAVESMRRGAPVSLEPGRYGLSWGVSNHEHRTFW